MDPSEQGIEQDAEWNRHVEIILEPDQRLSSAQQEVVTHDYGMIDGQLILKVRAKLVPYALQALHIDTKVIDMNPLAQQILVANIEDLREWLFN
jgi:hypothetical protein